MDEFLNRRNFIGASGIGAVALGTGAGSGALAAVAGPRAADPGRRSLLMKLGCQSPPSDDAHFGYLARFGIQNVVGYYTRADKTRLYPTVDELSRLIETGRRHGISVDMTETSTLGSGGEISPIMLGQSPGRDREIEAFQLTLKNCAAAGIPAVKYNMRVLPVLRSGEMPGRGDSRYRIWRLADAMNEPLTAAGHVDADTTWERITYFLDRVVPVANEYKIRIACHPEDPGTPSGYRGVTRVLGTIDGLKRFVSINESPYHGLNFCQGTISENLRDPKTEIFDVIRYFGERKKIFNVHFRNIQGHRDSFNEVFPDNGDVDFVQALRAYRDVGYDGMIMPDHVPLGTPADMLQNFSFCYGYIRGLMQSAQQY
ncbi:MAG: D-mannonate dehydratase [Bradyrhizobium sp.]|nr:D-mannonate dehydratase [Bradyrhizobium sp.]